MRKLRTTLLAALLLLLFACQAAAETTPPRGPTDPNAISAPATLDGFPEGHRLNGLKARAIAKREPRIQAALAKYPKAKPEVYLKGQTRWQVGWFTPGTGTDRKEIAQVLIDDASGKVTEAWTGPYVAWTMARGYPGAFGRKINDPWIWVPMTILFIAPFLTPRRPWRLFHLDLFVLAGFGVSVAFFNDARLDLSVPIVGPLLLYLLVRSLMVAFKNRGQVAAPEPLPLLVPVGWLAVALVFLIGFRVGLNIESSNVIDVGYSGVIGADYLMAGEPLYDNFPKDNQSGDTYGPVAYATYIPFEQTFPWKGKWDELWSAHAAAIAFDLLTMLTLLALGWRLRGPGLGVVFAYLWAAWPFTAYALNSNSNDALVALSLALTLLVAARPIARGFMAIVGGMTKFATLILVPVMATHLWQERRLRTLLLYSLGALLAMVIVWAPIFLSGESPSTVFDRTVRFQFGREAPFSFWGYYELALPQHIWQGLVVAFALLAPFLPRRRDLVGLAAISAAIVIAVELAVTYWFYLYLVWFMPALIVALAGSYGAPQREPLRRPAATAAV